MQEIFKIWIDRLKEGIVQKIDGLFDPSFLGIDEKELKFPTPVKVNGEAYLADRHLVVHLQAMTLVRMPCAICNEMCDADLKVGDFYHSEMIDEIPNALFDFSTPLREALLIELPRYRECCDGNCPERAALTPYLRSSQRREELESINLPFADL